MSKKPQEIRCPNTQHVKGRDIRCGRFLAEIRDDEIRIPCSKCGALHSIIRDAPTGLIRMQEIPKGSALISKKEEK